MFAQKTANLIARQEREKGLREDTGTIPFLNLYLFSMYHFLC